MEGGGWASVPQDVLARIVNGMPFQDFVAARGVCRHWRRSCLWVSSLSISISDPCMLVRVADVLSRCHSLSTLDMYGFLLNLLLENCDWSALSKSLQSLSLCFPAFISETLSARVCTRISGCVNLSELSLDILGDAQLSTTVLSRLKKLYLGRAVCWESVQSMLQNCTNLQELFIYGDHGHELNEYSKLLIDAPKLEDLSISSSCPYKLEIHAPLARSVKVCGIGTLHIDAESVHEMTLGAGRYLIKGPEYLRRLSLGGWCDDPEELVSSLLSLQAAPTIKCLRICMDMSGCDGGVPSTRISRTCFRALAGLRILEELDLSLDIIFQLEPQVEQFNNFLPMLKIVRLNCLSGYAEVLEADCSRIEKFERSWSSILALVPHAMVKLKYFESADHVLISLFEGKPEMSRGSFPSCIEVTTPGGRHSLIL